ncbi:ribonuclease domain-containing protein [Comamonas sp. NLF-1-9]|uniref:ribonuclease domain-containing protein n=1 Tax=Comamonas sp. NLF-1-9 TaxID=2853163 RepID=UPI001C471DEE|nr:ribonuclease domain-containing protein [Comamonas sp. NLF-1-9]QXL83973.1 ribonuclease N [Comamonas sp. NLF-1-9]
MSYAFTTGWRQWVAAALLAGVCLTGPASARQPAPAAPAAASVALAELPSAARSTYARIHQGGPFPHDKDGSVFGNYERQLPLRQRGYYREYTVRTPGVRGRGARRIVCGGAARTPDACYYSGDHYASFRLIAQ